MHIFPYLWYVLPLVLLDSKSYENKQSGNILSRKLGNSIYTFYLPGRMYRHLFKELCLITLHFGNGYFFEN